VRLAGGSPTAEARFVRRIRPRGSRVRVPYLNAIPLVLVACAVVSNASRGQPVSVQCRPDEAAGRITGTVSDSSGAPISGATLLIPHSSCAASTGAHGSFTIAGIPPGTYVIRTRYIGYEPTERAGVVVRARANTRLDIVLVPHDYNVRLADVPLLPRCHDLISGPPSRDDDQLAAAALCTAIAISVQLGRPPDAFCVSVNAASTREGTDPPPEVVAGLARLGITAHPMSECEWTNKSPPLRVRANGMAAWSVYIEPPLRIAADTARVSIAYHVAMLWAQGWDCTFARGPRGWYPAACRETWIS
jgi:hypothetical protein